MATSKAFWIRTCAGESKRERNRRLTAPPSKKLEATDRGWGLCVEFEFRGDRWSHQIAACTPGQPFRALLESVEGTPQDRWPPSPTFQELVLDQGLITAQRDAPSPSRIAQLLGKAGNSFWSASFELFSSPLKLVVDVACRAASDRGFLGSTYHVTSSLIQHEHEGTLRLKGSAVGSMEWVASTGALRRDNDRPQNWTVSPTSEAAHQTLRWIYEFRVTTDCPTT